MQRKMGHSRPKRTGIRGKGRKIKYNVQLISKIDIFLIRGQKYLIGHFRNLHTGAIHISIFHWFSV